MYSKLIRRHFASGGNSRPQLGGGPCCRSSPLPGQLSTQPMAPPPPVCLCCRSSPPRRRRRRQRTSRTGWAGSSCWQRPRRSSRFSRRAQQPEQRQAWAQAPAETWLVGFLEGGDHIGCGRGSLLPLPSPPLLSTARYSMQGRRGRTGGRHAIPGPVTRCSSRLARVNTLLQADGGLAQLRPPCAARVAERGTARRRPAHASSSLLLAARAERSYLKPNRRKLVIILCSSGNLGSASLEEGEGGGGGWPADGRARPQKTQAAQPSPVLGLPARPPHIHSCTPRLPSLPAPGPPALVGPDARRCRGRAAAHAPTVIKVLTSARVLLLFMDACCMHITAAVW